MKLSVIIVNYNVKYFLHQALHAVFKSEVNFDYEVFVVDNGSVDGSVAMVEESFPQVRLIASPENLGFSRGNNLAIRESKAEYVLLLNPDTIIREDTLQQVVDFMDQHPDAGALGVKMFDGQGIFLPESKRGFPSPEVAFYKMSGLSRLFPKSKVFGRYHLGFLDPDRIHEVDVLSGAFMLMRRSVLDKVGLLDEDYFMYGEDIDLSYRITLGGYKNYYYPHAPIIHFKGESTKKGSLNYVRVFYQAMIIFARKHIRDRSGGWYIFLLQLAIYFRAGVALLSRAWLSVGWQVVDLLVLTGVLFSGMWFWEHVVRVEDGLKFTDNLWLVNFPLYISIWMLSNYLSGAYDKPVRLFNLFGGMLIGTLLIGALYGFFPDFLRSSRGIILFGFLVGTSAMSLLRYLVALVKGKTRHLFYSERKLLIVGSAPEAQRVTDLLKDISVRREYIGFISPVEKDVADSRCLGTLEHIDEILEIADTDEIIFCARDVSSFEIISQITSIRKDIDFKIATEESTAIIGSNSKDTAGELLTYDIGFRINKAYLIRLKRFMDIVMSVIFLLLSPLLFLIQKNKVNFFPNIFRVLVGEKTWVSYCKKFDQEEQLKLPLLKEGVLCPLDNLSVNKDEVGHTLVNRLNYLYAKDYSLFTDLQTIFNALGKLGS